MQLKTPAIPTAAIQEQKIDPDTDTDPEGMVNQCRVRYRDRNEGNGSRMVREKFSYNCQKSQAGPGESQSESLRKPDVQSNLKVY
jgi:hypothetical protein